MVDFLFIMIELFHCFYSCRYKRKTVEEGVFWVTLGKYFGWKGTIPSKSPWREKMRDIPVSYVVERLTDDYFILSQYTHLTDRQMDGQTELRQRYQHKSLHYMQLHGKKR